MAILARWRAMGLAGGEGVGYAGKDMKVSEIEKVAQTRGAVGPGNPEAEVGAAFTSDLLSDVMGNAPENSVLVTIQAHATTVAVALVADIRAILVCSGRGIPQDMADAARKEGIAIYVTALDQYHASIALAALLGDLP